MIKLRDLQYLLALNEHKHFGRAAEACFVSQPTLSGQIIKLEEQLGLELIERHRRKIMLTQAGEQLVEKAKLVLNAANQFEQTAKALLDPLAGDLHLGSIPTLAPYLLPHIMKGLSEALPNINFYLHERHTKDLLRDLDKGDLDLLILPRLEGMDDFECIPLFDEPLLLAIPHQHCFANKKHIQLKELEGQHILTLEDGHCLRDQALGYCFSAGADEDNRFQASSLETLRHMVGAGLGITLIPKLAVSANYHSEMIRYIPITKPVPTREIVLLVRPKYPRMDCIKTLVESIRGSTGGLALEG